MSSTQEGSSVATSKSKKSDKNRRSWTQAEETSLIIALKEMVRSQKYKADNGFKAGYLLKLEADLQASCPGTDLVANPHITSKLSTWKKNYASLRGILSRSGVGFSSRGNFLIECEEDQWAQIVKADPNARLLWNKPWPFYEDWQEIFGTDRANGDHAEDVEEAFIDIGSLNVVAAELGEDLEKEASQDNEFTNENGDQASHSIKVDASSQRTRRSKKKAKMSEDLQGVCDMLATMNDATNARLDHLASRIGWEYDSSKARQETFDQLKGISGLSGPDRWVVCELIATNDKRLDIWRGIQPEDRAEYVDHLMKISRD